VRATERLNTDTAGEFPVVVPLIIARRHSCPAQSVF
jgi:hypothetical protein